MSDTGGKARKDVAGMTSKEAIKSIEKQSTLDFLNYDSLCLFEQELKVIQKDLEILEILKRFEWLVYQKRIQNVRNWYLDEYSKPVELTEEEAKKLKEWLNG